jgi:transglutaminase-like putative cysteine protease
MQMLSLEPVAARMQYSMVSFLEYSYGLDEQKSVLESARRLPSGFNPKTLALAKDLRSRAPDDRALMQSVLSIFASEPFVYTITPPLLGRHSVDEFLFETRSGYCEHYSSAFAVLMRAAGIPARIVTGYLGGEINPLGGYLIVRQADAHAWTEVWLEHEGWVRVDPTAAVAPGRIERGAESVVRSVHGLRFFMWGDAAFPRHLRLAWDWAANGWNQWVPGYTADRQRILLTRVGFDDATWEKLAGALLVASALVTLVLALAMLQRLGKRVRDPTDRAYSQFCRKLDSAGFPRRPSEGPLAYAERVCGARPDLAEVVREFLSAYAEIRYGLHGSARRVAELCDLARRFDPDTQRASQTRGAAKPAALSNLP